MGCSYRVGGGQVCQGTISTGIISEGDKLATHRNPEACCYFLVGSGWLVLFPGGLWMVGVISWWALDGWCYFLVGSGWLVLFPGGLWMVGAISWWALDGWCYFLVGSGWLVLFPGGLWMVGVISWWALDGWCYFLVGSGWLVLFPGGLWMVGVISWWALDGWCYFLVGSGWLVLFPGGLWMVGIISWWARDPPAPELAVKLSVTRRENFAGATFLDGEFFASRNPPSPLSRSGGCSEEVATCECRGMTCQHQTRGALVDPDGVVQAVLFQFCGQELRHLGDPTFGALVRDSGRAELCPEHGEAKIEDVVPRLDGPWFCLRCMGQSRRGTGSLGGNRMHMCA